MMSEEEEIYVGNISLWLNNAHNIDDVYNKYREYWHSEFDNVEVDGPFTQRVFKEWKENREL